MVATQSSEQLAVDVGAPVVTLAEWIGDPQGIPRTEPSMGGKSQWISLVQLHDGAQLFDREEVIRPGPHPAPRRSDIGRHGAVRTDECNSGGQDGAEHLVCRGRPGYDS